VNRDAERLDWRRVAPLRAVGRARELARDAVVAAIASELVSSAARIALLERLGAVVGPGSYLRAGLRVSRPRALVLGTEVFCNAECLLEATGGIELGDRVSLGRRCSLVTTEHVIGPAHRRAGEPRPAPIRVGDGSWLGAGVLVLPGVTIGSGVVVGAGSVVASDLEADTLYLGVPARPVRQLERTEPLAPGLAPPPPPGAE
jgi:maltose O-acetyltransferase